MEYSLARVIPGSRKIVPGIWHWLNLRKHVAKQSYETYRGAVFLAEIMSRYHTKTHVVLAALHQLQKQNVQFRIGGWRKTIVPGRVRVMFIVTPHMDLLENEIARRCAKTVERASGAVDTIGEVGRVKIEDGADMTAVAEALEQMLNAHATMSMNLAAIVREFGRENKKRRKFQMVA